MTESHNSIFVWYIHTELNYSHSSVAPVKIIEILEISQKV